MIKVIVVDDSSFYRNLIADLLKEDAEIEVLGVASDAFDAREKIKKFNPDVITLDVEMPGMDGIDFLEKIMRLRPMPVIMVSTLTGAGTDTAIRALQTGAVECIGKPAAQSAAALNQFGMELCAKVKMAAKANLRPQQQTRVVPPPKPARKLSPRAPAIIAIGSSTGGVEALTEVLTHLPPGCPPIVISQHMPPVFTASMAMRLDALCALEIREAAEGTKLIPGRVCVAPGGKHLTIAGTRGQFTCRISDDPPVNNHKPSVDVMFDSVTERAGHYAQGIILTGMGKDGAKGLLKLRQSGAHTIGQDEASCVVYGMPHAAMELGGVEEELPLTAIAHAIEERCFA